MHAVGSELVGGEKCIFKDYKSLKWELRNTRHNVHMLATNMVFPGSQWVDPKCFREVYEKWREGDFFLSKEKIKCQVTLPKCF